MDKKKIDGIVSISKDNMKTLPRARVKEDYKHLYLSLNIFEDDYISTQRITSSKSLVYGLAAIDIPKKISQYMNSVKDHQLFKKGDEFRVLVLTHLQEKKSPNIGMSENYFKPSIRPKIRESINTLWKDIRNSSLFDNVKKDLFGLLRKQEELIKNSEQMDKAWAYGRCNR